jgi:plastocyanin
VKARAACVAAVLAVAIGPVAAALRAPQAQPVQAAGTVRGRVDLSGEAAPASPRPGVAALGHDTLYRPGTRKEAVVYFDTAPQPAFEEGSAPPASMRQEHEAFVPHVLAIRAGTVVEFPNFDPVYHNVFSLSKPKPFDLGRYGSGRSKSVRFDQPGIVRVFCDIHSHMSAFILVFAHRFFAVSDAAGRYRIDRVPPGTYTVTAWYEGSARASRPVTVPPGGGAVDVDFTLR